MRKRESKEQHRLRQRDWVITHKINGLCTQCNCKAVRWGMCDKHAKRFYNDRIEMGHKRNESGQCRDCQRKLSSTSKTYCTMHQEYHRLYSKWWRQQIY